MITQNRLTKGYIWLIPGVTKVINPEFWAFVMEMSSNQQVVVTSASDRYGVRCVVIINILSHRWNFDPKYGRSFDECCDFQSQKWTYVGKQAPEWQKGGSALFRVPNRHFRAGN